MKTTHNEAQTWRLWFILGTTAALILAAIYLGILSAVFFYLFTGVLIVVGAELRGKLATKLVFLWWPAIAFYWVRDLIQK